MLNLIVTSREESWRLDRYVQEKSPDWISRTFIQKAIKNGEVTVNGRKKKPSYRVKIGDIITLNLPEKPEKVEILPENIPLSIIYEDKDIIVINKAPGIITHPTPSVTTGTLVNAILFHCKDLQGIGGELRPGIVHRLDKDTSGVIVVAKNDKAHQSLSQQFKDRVTEKVYAAVVHGNVKKDYGAIEVSLARNPVLRTKMAALEWGKPAVTYFKVIRRFSNIASLVFAYPKTGRTHQIRVHMKYMGNPLLGDELYGKGKKDEIYNVRRQMLHALRLSFYHPSTKEKVIFTAPLPEDFKNVLRTLSKLEES
ncbi:RluA family pseudouridine synthase [Thermosipho ferrireducens]|uniref:Pseudouridine synthase n=1 Tax=Thermosipho ferrireducens TaxID=2571116 RepID=A0ABX7SB50_9BACT|nr:RluA family pseudouridine synthase [Thermosipho ferrireducens]QTA38716.1 RluA family pseudouridine synthase [Thermosipho ferrireducens]